MFSRNSATSGFNAPIHCEGPHDPTRGLNEPFSDRLLVRICLSKASWRHDVRDLAIPIKFGGAQQFVPDQPLGILFFQLAQLLPMEETFLLLFRFDNPLDSSVEFMKVRKRR